MCVSPQKNTDSNHYDPPCISRLASHYPAPSLCQQQHPHHTDSKYGQIISLILASASHTITTRIQHLQHRIYSRRSLSFSLSSLTDGARPGARGYSDSSVGPFSFSFFFITETYNNKTSFKRYSPVRETTRRTWFKRMKDLACHTHRLTLGKRTTINLRKVDFVGFDRMGLNQ